jgi:hypothetical protein
MNARGYSDSEEERILEVLGPTFSRELRVMRRRFQRQRSGSITLVPVAPVTVITVRFVMPIRSFAGGHCSPSRRGFCFAFWLWAGSFFPGTMSCRRHKPPCLI